MVILLIEFILIPTVLFIIIPDIICLLVKGHHLDE